MPMKTVVITVENPFQVLADLYQNTTLADEDYLEEGVVLHSTESSEEGYITISGYGKHDTYVPLKIGKSTEGSLLDCLENNNAICFMMAEYTTENRLEARRLYLEFLATHPELKAYGGNLIRGKVLIASEEICEKFAPSKVKTSD